MRRHRVTEAAQQGLVLHRVLGKRRGGQLAQGRQFSLGRQTQVVQGGTLTLRLRSVSGQPLAQAGGVALQLLGGVERRVHINLAGDAVAAAGHAAQGEGRVSNGTGRDIVDARGRYRSSGLVLGGSRQRQHRVEGHHVNLRTKEPGLGVTCGTFQVFLTSQRMLSVAGVLLLHRVQGLRDRPGRRNLHRQHVHRGTAGLRARRTQGAGRLRQGAGEHAVHLRHAERSLQVAAHTRQVRADGGGRQHGPGDGVLLRGIQQSLLGGYVNAERQAHRLRRRGGGTTRQGGVLLLEGAARLPEGNVFFTGGGGGIVGVEQLLQAHAAGRRNLLTGGQGTVDSGNAGEAVERREPVGNHVGEGMVDPEEPTVTRYGAAHGHALIGGEGLSEQALRPDAHRRGQIRVRQVRGVLLRLSGAVQLPLIYEQVNTREECFKRQNLLGGGTIGNAGAHAEALILAVELHQRLTQQGEVGVRGALQNLRSVVAGVRRVNRRGKIDTSRVGGQRQPGAVSAVRCGVSRGGASIGSSLGASGCGSISYAHGGLSQGLD